MPILGRENVPKLLKQVDNKQHANPAEDHFEAHHDLTDSKAEKNATNVGVHEIAEEQFDYEPLSSSEFEDASPARSPTNATRPKDLSRNSSSSVVGGTMDGAGEKRVSPRKRKRDEVSLEGSASKQGAVAQEEEVDLTNMDVFSEFYNSANGRKLSTYSRAGYGSKTTSNIHAKASPKTKKTTPKKGKRADSSKQSPNGIRTLDVNSTKRTASRPTFKPPSAIVPPPNKPASQESPKFDDTVTANALASIRRSSRLNSTPGLKAAPVQPKPQSPIPSSELKRLPGLPQIFTNSPSERSKVKPPPNTVTPSDTSSPLNSLSQSPSPPDSPIFSSQADKSSTATDPSTLALEALCPICRKPVGREVILTHGTKMRGRFHQQAEFCRLHRAAAAQEEWEKRGYPRIEWGEMEARITQHHDAIQRVLNGTEKSVFAAQLNELSRREKKKTVMQRVNGGDLEGMVPGYYGSRGARTIANNLSTTFGPTIRRLLAGDPLAASLGVVGYVQAVLTPEIGVRLVMQDLSVDFGKAREIINESKQIGELLNEELEDVGKGRKRRKEKEERGWGMAAVDDEGSGSENEGDCVED